MSTCKTCGSEPAKKTSPCSSGSAVCDPRYATLPTATELKLIGSDGECLANFPQGVCGFVTFLDGKATVTNAPIADIQAMVDYLTDGNTADGLARDVDGQLIEGTPPEFDHILALKSSCQIAACGDKPEWYKWRGPANTQGFIYWNGKNFTFGGVNEAGVVTSAVLEDHEEGYLPAYPSSVDPTITETKTQGYLKPSESDLYYVGDDGVARRMNPGQVKGFVYYGEASACDSTITPSIVNLCDVTTPPCIDRPEPIRLIGCAVDGAPASTGATQILPTGYCNTIAANPGGGGVWANYHIGLSAFPGNNGSLRPPSTGASGSFNTTVSSTGISNAAGYTLPSGVSHIAVQVRVVLSASISERRNLSVTVGGITIVEASAYSWDGDNEDQDIETATAIVPVDSNGAVAIDVNHSSNVGSTYDLNVNLLMAFACAEPESTN